MSEITSPIMLNDTGQDLVAEAQNIVIKLQSLINAVKPTAADIPLAAISGMTADDVQEGVAELKSNLTDLIKSKTFNSTTNASGVISSGLNFGTNPIVNVIVYNPSAVYYGTISAVSDSAGLQYITIRQLNGSIVANTTVQGTIYYLNLN